MAIGLSKVSNRKAKRSSTHTPRPKSSDDGSANSGEASLTAAEAVELKSNVTSEAWSTRGLAREGRSVKRERSIGASDLSGLWLDWTSAVTGSETSSRMLSTVRQILDLETFVFEFLVYDLEIPKRIKKRLLVIRSRSLRALHLRRLLAHHC